MSIRTRKQNPQKYENNRINLLMAVIFVIGAATIVKLYDLQVRKYDHYMDMAKRQQQSMSKVEPQRGRIFIQDNQEWSSDNELFPLATNKDFATLYARPNAIKNPQAVAEGLFSVIDQPFIEKDVENDLAFSEYATSSSETLKAAAKELEVRKRKDALIAEYVSMLSRPNDPYEVIEPKIELDDAQRIKAMGLEGVDYSPIQGRYYPEKNIGAHIMGFVGFVGDTKQGRYGLEGFFEKELGGKAGEVNIESTGKGETSSVSDKQTVIGEDGSDLILTINRSVQYETCRLLGESVKKHGASGGSVVIMDPKTGAILAMCAYPDYDPNNYRKVKDIDIYNNPVIFDQFEPGSTFKAITVAAAVDQNKVGPNTTYKDTGFLMIEGWPKPISNSDYATRGAHGITTINTVLQDSLNCGSIFAMQSIGPAVFSDYVKKFGFGEKTGIELETESSGNIANLTGKKIRPINAATASFGQGISATPIQVAASYAVMANGGMLVKPYLVKAVISPTGEQSLTQTTEIRRVIDKRTASLMTGMLVNAVENGHASKAKVPGYYVAGKTGTAQVASKTSKGYEKGNTIQTFVGYAPANDPKFVMITRLDDPKDSKFAESSAVPLFGEIANFVLNYYQVPQERKIEAK